VRTVPRDNRTGTPESITRRLGFSDQDDGVDRLLNCAAAADVLPSRRTLEAAFDQRRRSPSGTDTTETITTPGAKP
jgi:hypothetical protein